MTTVLAQLNIPPTQRSVPGSVDIAPAVFPEPKGPPAAGLNVNEVAARAVDSLSKALSSEDYDAASRLFIKEGYWRDHLALSWEFRNVQGPPAILEFLQNAAKSRDGFRLKKMSLDTSSAARVPQIVPFNGDGKLLGVQFFVNIETVIGFGIGVVKLVEDGEGWKFFTFYTCLEGLKGYEEGINGRRPAGVQHGEHKGRQSWLDRRALENDFQSGGEPAVLIVGAGQAGLTAASRLKMLGVQALIIDQNERVGDNWRKRYHQLVLHDPVWYDHMPYMKFPPQWPIFTPKDKLASFFEAYADLMELNIWMKTQLGESKWDDSKGAWTVTVNRKKDDGSTETRMFHPRHIIQATGHSGKKNLPDIKGIDSFKGHLISHSSEFPGARVDGKGKKAVVVGSCNSGHDICQDFVEKGYDVTMVQRSSTLVVSSKAIVDIGLKGLYEEDGPPLEDVDYLLQSLPLPLFKALQLVAADREAKHDTELLQGLSRVGFKLDSGPDGAGLFNKYFQRGGGYYIDVGASQLIIDGAIKIKQGQEITEVLPHGLRFADGTELEADEIVLATGYQNMRTQTREIFGDAVADRARDVWGYNAEGEMRTIWQQSGHPGFWFHGGNLALCRFYSRLLALQIKGLEEGLYQYGET